MSENGTDMEERTTRSRGSGRSWLKGAFVGALLGSVAALLFAPQSGDQTVQSIRKQGEVLRDDVEKRFLEGRLAAEKNLAGARSTVADWLVQGSELLSRQADEVRPQ